MYVCVCVCVCVRCVLLRRIRHKDGLYFVVLMGCKFGFMGYLINKPRRKQTRYHRWTPQVNLAKMYVCVHVCVGIHVFVCGSFILQKYFLEVLIKNYYESSRKKYGCVYVCVCLLCVCVCVCDGWGMCINFCIAFVSNLCNYAYLFTMEPTCVISGHA